MDWPASLEIVVAHTRHERFRALCADDHPRREEWRRKVVAMAAGLEGRPVPEFPPLIRQAGNAIGAAARVVGAFVRGERVRVPDDVREARLAVCRGCEHNGERESGGIRCTKCGCFGGGIAGKAAWATEACPLDPPRWDIWEAPTDAG